MRKKTTSALLVAAFLMAGALLAQDKWVPGSNGHVDGFTLYGGNENGKNLFLCAGYMGGTYHPGKIVGSNCNFGYGGQEITASNYYTLQVTQESLKRYSWHKAANPGMPKING